MHFSRRVLPLVLLVLLDLAQGTSIAEQDDTDPSHLDRRLSASAVLVLLPATLVIIKKILLPLAIYGFSYGFKAFGVLALGLAAVEAFCIFTPFCAKYFADSFYHLFFNRQTAKEQVQGLAHPYITQDIMNYVAPLVGSAFKRYPMANQEEEDANDFKIMPRTMTTAQ